MTKIRGKFDKSDNYVEYKCRLCGRRMKRPVYHILAMHEDVDVNINVMDKEEFVNRYFIKFDLKPEWV